MASVSKWSLGFSSHTGDFVAVIPKGSPLPARRCVAVTTAVDGQPDMGLYICMGESGRAEENYQLSSIRLDGFEKSETAGAPCVKLTFYEYEHSVIKIGVRYKANQQEQEISIIPGADLSEEDVKRLRELVKKMASQETPQEVAGPDLGVIALPAVV